MVDADPPTIEVVGRVMTTTPDGQRLAGRYGNVPERDTLGFITERDSHEHRIRALDAYAISKEALDMLESLGVETVLVLETDTSDLYEFVLEDFTTFGTVVPERFLEYASDPQRYHKRSDPLAVWRDYGGAVYGREETPDSVEFERASKLNEFRGDA